MAWLRVNIVGNKREYNVIQRSAKRYIESVIVEVVSRVIIYKSNNILYMILLYLYEEFATDAFVAISQSCQV
jgi:hypothetical protein